MGLSAIGLDIVSTFRKMSAIKPSQAVLSVASPRSQHPFLASMAQGFTNASPLVTACYLRGPSGDIRRSISNLAMTSWNHFGARRAKSSNFLRAANASIRVLVGAEEKPA